MLVILLGSGNGLKNGVESNFGDYATNSITLYGGWTSKEWKGYDRDRRIRLTNRDLEILEKEFPEVDEVAANSWLSSKKLCLRGQLHGSLAARFAAQGSPDRGDPDRQRALHQRSRHPRVPQIGAHRRGDGPRALPGRRSARQVHPRGQPRLQGRGRHEGRRHAQQRHLHHSAHHRTTRLQGQRALYQRRHHHGQGDPHGPRDGRVRATDQEPPGRRARLRPHGRQCHLDQQHHGARQGHDDRLRGASTSSSGSSAWARCWRASSA